MQHPQSSVAPAIVVDNMVVRIGNDETGFDVVRNVSLVVQPGETVCIVGESGSGKTLTALALMGLHTNPVHITQGRIRIGDVDVTGLSERKLAALRGGQVAMVFQDPMTSLNPVLTIGEQIREVIAAHRKGLGRARLDDLAEGLLKRVGIPAPRQRLKAYPHQLSGGMRQRVLIAMAVANNPRLIIADEPTTALDVTIQAQVMDVMRASIAESGAALLLITHDIGLVAETADRVMVMYAGQIVEEGTVFDVLGQPRHPYTRALMASVPRPSMPPEENLVALGGEPPRLNQLPPGCSFQPRCPHAAGRAECRQTEPRLRQIAGGQRAACHFAEELVSRIFEGEQA